MFNVLFFHFVEVALVSWTESVGLTLIKRDLNSMTLQTPDSHLLRFTILQIFPFTSETKRMGIVVRVRYSQVTFSASHCDRPALVSSCDEVMISIKRLASCVNVFAI